MAPLSHGVDFVLERLVLKGATESRMLEQVEENMERSSSVLRMDVPSVSLHRGELLKATEKSSAVEGLIVQETRFEAVWAPPEQGADTVNKIGE